MQRAVDALGEGLGLPFLLLRFLWASKENEEEEIQGVLCNTKDAARRSLALPYSQFRRKHADFEENMNMLVILDITHFEAFPHTTTYSIEVVSSL